MRDFTLKVLREQAEAGNLLYVASAYTLYPDGVDLACRAICLVAAELMRRRVRVFCPIAHSHTIARLGGLDPIDHEMWMYQDEPFVPACHGLVLTKMRGFDKSKGMFQERLMFEDECKPVWELDPRILGIVGA